MALINEKAVVLYAALYPSAVFSREDVATNYKNTLKQYSYESALRLALRRIVNAVRGWLAWRS